MIYIFIIFLVVFIIIKVGIIYRNIYNIIDYIYNSYKFIKSDKKYCISCKYSFKNKTDNEFYCIKNGYEKDSAIDKVIIPKLCEEVNYNNKCKDYSFDIFWRLK